MTSWCTASVIRQQKQRLIVTANLQALLSRAQARNLKLNPTKIQFKLTQLKYMGHHVSEEGVAPDPTEVEAILQFPQPTSKSALQRFLGMTNYLNAFCPNLSSVIHPLLQLTRKDTDFQWSSVHTSAFEAAPRRFELPSLHILHVRCQFCVIPAVERNLQFLPV